MKPTRRLQARVEARDFNQSLSLLLFEYLDDGHGNRQRWAVQGPLELVEVPDYEFCVPTAEFSFETGQRLMDDLWHAGIRPSSGEGSVGQLGATEKHLDDMRTIVAAKLGVEF